MALTILQTMYNAQLATKIVAMPTVTVAPQFVSTYLNIELKTASLAVSTRFNSPLNSLSRRPDWMDPESRQGYLEAAVEQGVAWQIRVNRQKRSMSQDTLAALIGTGQSAISRAEDPDYGGHSLDTLVKIAHAFDCALLVKFVAYSQLAADSEDLSPEALYAPTFNQEINSLLGDENDTRRYTRINR